jgi:hypothetical protein
MIAILAIGTAVLMTAVGVAIGGLALEFLLFAISRSLEMRVSSPIEQAVMPVVIHLNASDSSRGSMDWVGEIAA